MAEILGGIEEVKDAANSLEIQNLARFAVDVHNKKENTHLAFKKVVNAKKQVVAGMMYYITLEAVDGDKTNVYEAKVWEKAGKNCNEVEEFKLIRELPTEPSKSSESTA